MTDGNKRPPPPSLPIKLSMNQRVISVLAGTALVTTGGWAEIASGHDGAGTVAFVVSGSLIAVLGIAGRLPTRLSGKDYSVEFEERVHEAAQERTAEAISEVVNELPQEAKVEIARSVKTDELDELYAPPIAFAKWLFATTAKQSLDFQATASRRLRPILETLDMHIIPHENLQPGDYLAANMIADSSDGKRLLVWLSAQEYNDDPSILVTRVRMKQEELPANARGLFVIDQAPDKQIPKLHALFRRGIAVVALDWSDERIKGVIGRLMIAPMSTTMGGDPT